MDALAAARLLANARLNNEAVPWQSILPASEDEAIRIQDATLDIIGPVGAWKVGAKGLDTRPACSPLPASRVLPSGSTLTGPEWKLRGIEVELGLRLGLDLDPRPEGWTPQQLMAAVDALVPVIEVVETRLAGWRESDPLATLADVQSSGALIVGAPLAFVPSDVVASAAALPATDLRTLEATLTVNGKTQAKVTGGNPAGDVWRLLAWLVERSAARGRPLRAGQVITTGSCSGVFFAPEGALVQGDVAGVGRVEVQF
jgi:2-keto-4-pentenoate hydratase